MSKIRRAVYLFLDLPITTQFHLMTEFGFEPTWSKSLIEQRRPFFTGLREAGRSDEFCDYIIERYGP